MTGSDPFFKKYTQLLIEFHPTLDFCFFFFHFFHEGFVYFLFYLQEKSSGWLMPCNVSWFPPFCRLLSSCLLLKGKTFSGEWERCQIVKVLIHGCMTVMITLVVLPTSKRKFVIEIEEAHVCFIYSLLHFMFKIYFCFIFKMTFQASLSEGWGFEQKNTFRILVLKIAEKF